MITASYLFQRMPKGIVFLRARPILTTTPTAQNITKIELYGKLGTKTLYKVTLDSMGTSQFYPNLKAKIAGTIQLDGDWSINYIDNTGKFIIIETNIEKLLNQVPINTGTCNITGVVDHGVYEPYEEVFNNDGKSIGYAYDSNKSFILDYNKDLIANTPIAIQLNVIESGTVTATIQWSLDGVYWMDFPTAVALSASLNTPDGVILSDLPAGVKIRIDTTGSVKYYLLAC